MYCRLIIILTEEDLHAERQNTQPNANQRRQTREGI